MNIYEHFACYMNVPIRIEDVKAHILETGYVSRIVFVPVQMRSKIIHGAFHRIRDLTSYATGEVIGLVGYDEDLPPDWKRVVVVKEMLHALDPENATSPTKVSVDALIDHLILSDAELAVAPSLAAHYDNTGLLNALAILMPRDALDKIRPIYKRDGCSVEQVAAWFNVPKVLAKIALTDQWRRLADSIT